MATTIHHPLKKVQMKLMSSIFRGSGSEIKRPSLDAWVWPAQVGVREASIQARHKARRASRKSEADARSNLGRAWDLVFSSIKAWSGWPCHRAFEAFVLALDSTKAWSGWLCHLAFKAWILESNSTKAWIRWPYHQPFKTWVLAGTSIKARASDLAIESSKLQRQPSINPVHCQLRRMCLVCFDI